MTWLIIARDANHGRTGLVVLFLLDLCFELFQPFDRRWPALVQCYNLAFVVHFSISRQHGAESVLPHIHKVGNNSHTLVCVVKSYTCYVQPVYGLAPFIMLDLDRKPEILSKCVNEEKISVIYVCPLVCSRLHCYLILGYQALNKISRLVQTCLFSGGGGYSLFIYSIELLTTTFL